MIQYIATEILSSRRSDVTTLNEYTQGFQRQV